jgi:hypothetical protein
MLPDVADQEQPPYAVGDEIAKFVLVGDQVHVSSARILRVEQRGDGWRITDEDIQQHDVPASGMSGDIQPLDDLLRHELKTKGQGFVVVETIRDYEPELRPAPPPRELDPPARELDGGRDGIG